MGTSASNGVVVGGSFCFGAFVGAVSILFIHPVIRSPLALEKRVKQLGVFLGIIVVGGGGGAAGLTFLADRDAAGMYLGGVLVGGLAMFGYEEFRARHRARRLRSAHHRSEQRRMLLGQPIPESELERILDGE